MYQYFLFFLICLYTNLLNNGSLTLYNKNNLLNNVNNNQFVKNIQFNDWKINNLSNKNYYFNSFHFDIKHNFNWENWVSVHTNLINQFGIGVNSEILETKNILLIKWTQYENDWINFIKFYPKYNLNYSFYFFHENIDGIYKQEKNTKIIFDTIDFENNQVIDLNFFLDENYSGWIKIKLSKDDNYLFLNLIINAAIHGYSWYSVNTQVILISGLMLSTFNLINFKNYLEENININNPLNFESNYSGCIFDQRNIIDPYNNNKDQTTLLNNFVKNILKKYYKNWINFLQPYRFIILDNNNIAIISFKFFNPYIDKLEIWHFYKKINIILTSVYWRNEINKRFHIFPGKIVNFKNIQKNMIDDIPEIIVAPRSNNGGILRYHTTLNIEFDGLEDENENMIVNDQNVPVLDDKFQMQLVDSRLVFWQYNNKENKYFSNVYDIKLVHSNKYNYVYNIKIIIDNLIPELKLTLKGWNPNNFINQKELIRKPTDKYPNIYYDPEIDPNTGTKKQIIWIKFLSFFATPLDPINEKGEIINYNNISNYDLGFIAEGIVLSSGNNEIFNESNSVIYREGVDIKTLKPFIYPNNHQKLQLIKNGYWSFSGVWHYIQKLNDNSYVQKFAIIGGEYDNRYPNFLSIINNNNIVANFWETIHGHHLRDYLNIYINLTFEKIFSLSYEKIMAYWKDYTSSVILGRVSLSIEHLNYINLSTISELSFVIKIINNKIINIKYNIVSIIQNRLKKYKLLYLQDYNIFYKNQIIDNFSDEIFDLALAQKNQNQWIWINIEIKASQFSKLVFGNRVIQIGNYQNLNFTKIFNLQTININDQIFNFTNFSVNDLKIWLIKYIKFNINDIGIKLIYENDYNIFPLEEQIFLNFIEIKEFYKIGCSRLSIIVYSAPNSLLTYNFTTFTIVNNPFADIINNGDLAQLIIPIKKYNFSKMSINELKKWIINDIFNILKKYYFDISDNDFFVTNNLINLKNWNKLNFNNKNLFKNLFISNNFLKNFLNNQIIQKKIILMIHANNKSQILKNITKYILINDKMSLLPISIVYPHIFSKNRTEIKQNKIILSKNSLITKKYNFVWLISLFIIIIIFLILLIVFIIIRKKHGLGYKKNNFKKNK